MIITGSPVETLDFTDVDYWDELLQYLEWSKTHVFSLLSFCWGAQAALYHFYNIEKRLLPTAVDDIAVYNTPGLDILSRNVHNGINIIGTPDHRRFFILGHFEYDRDTLAKEYFRDKNKGLPIAPPENYYPGNDDRNTPNFIWCSYAHIFYHNWLNLVYQETPYVPEQIASVAVPAH